jgi:hypothetical protein
MSTQLRLSAGFLLFAEPDNTLGGAGDDHRKAVPGECTSRQLSTHRIARTYVMDWSDFMKSTTAVREARA